MTSTEPHPDILSDRVDDPLGEELLLQAVRDGSTAAYGILYARYRPMAVGIALRALSQADGSMAEDVAEVSFIRVLTALRNGKGPTDTMRSYLATTVRREAWRAQRRRRRQAEVVDLWAADEERSTPPHAEPSPSSTPDLGAHVLLREAFGGLSDRWRHVLWLTEVEGRKPADLAPLLGVSAGTASALAYRARNGLISAYLATYGRTTTEAACRAISTRLGRYVAAGSGGEGFADVEAHLEGCRSCREVTRGVDVLGGALAAVAPFGLLTAGWWAQAAVAGSTGLAGTGVLAGATSLGAHGVRSAGGSSGGTGLAVAAVVGVTALVGAAYVGLVRSDARGTTATPPAASAAPAGELPSRPSPGRSPRTTVAPVPSGPTVAVAPTNTSPERSAPSAPGTVAPPATPSSSTTPGSSTSTSTSTSTATSTPTSTSTTVPVPVERAGLSGRAAKPRGDGVGGDVPVPGVAVEVYDPADRRVASVITDEDGRWAVAGLAAGRYTVVALVPAAYRPATGPDPWQGGATWTAALGAVDLAGRDLDLVDLRLRDR